MSDPHTDPQELTVSSRIAREVLQYAIAAGADEAPLLAASGIDPAALADLEGRIPGGQIGRLWAAAEAATGDPDIGLHLAAHRTPGDPSLLGYLIQTAPTLGSAYEVLGRYFTLFSEGAHLHVTAGAPGASSARLEFRPLPGSYIAAAPRHPTEAYLAVFASIAPLLTGRRLPGLGVAFAFERPATGAAAHEAVFGVVPAFGAAVSSLRFDASALRWPGREASPRLHATLLGEAEDLLGGLQPSIPERVARVVADRFRGGVPTLGEVAASLAMAERTLQRHLGSEGTTFLEVVDAVRRRLAVAHLAGGALTLQEIAFLLGYSDPSAFSRAFKRWTGRTPGEYRARARAA